MKKITPEQFGRISKYIIMLDSDTFDYASRVIDDENLLSNKDKETYKEHLRKLVDTEMYSTGRDKELLIECETIYQQWILDNNK